MDAQTLNQIAQIASILEGDKQPKPNTTAPGMGGIKIVILQRGWVMAGRFSQSGAQCTLYDGYVIRKWGTTRGLGEIAENGPTKDTVLDKVPRVTFHELTIVASIDCEAAKWTSQFK